MESEVGLVNDMNSQTITELSIRKIHNMAEKPIISITKIIGWIRFRICILELVYIGMMSAAAENNRHFPKMLSSSRCTHSRIL